MPLLQSIASAAMPKIADFVPQGLANTLWAFSRLDFNDLPLIRAISSAARSRIGEFSSQNLSNTAWALASMGSQDEPLLASIASSALQLITELSPQDVSNTAWAFAKLELRNDPLLKSISAAAIQLIRHFGGQDLGITAWALAKLDMCDHPFMKAISSEAIRKMSELAPQNLANLAWAWSTLLVVDEPLMPSIAAQSIHTLGEFNIQNLANPAWSFSRLLFRDDPFLTAISASAMNRMCDLTCSEVPQESYAIAWSFWRTSVSSEIAKELCSGVASGLVADALVYGLFLSDREWCMNARDEQQLQIALGRGFPPCALRTLWLRRHICARMPPIRFASMYHMYRKLSKCIDYVSAVIERPPSSSHILERIETFGQELGQWLKVAGGDKASLTESTLVGCTLREHEISTEFGAFVGYSGIRFAKCSLREGLAGVSLEVDPVHASVARYFIDLAGMSPSAEVWLGLLQDTLAILPERVGERSMAFSFMDQRGTTFHDDLALVEKMQLLPALTSVVADNVNKPGAPIFLWHMSRTLWFNTILWSMSEFASIDIEDWQSVSTGKPLPRS